MKEKEGTFNFHMWEKTEHYCSYIDFFPQISVLILFVCVCVCVISSFSFQYVLKTLTVLWTTVYWDLELLLFNSEILIYKPYL